MKNKKPWYHRHVKNGIDRVFRWSPERKKALARAFHHKESIKVLIIKGRNKGQFKNTYVEFFTCEKCAIVVPRKQKQVDHINPTVDPLKGFQGWDIYVERKMVTSDKLQVLCKNCHAPKSIAENTLRRKVKKGLK